MKNANEYTPQIHQLRQFVRQSKKQEVTTHMEEITLLPALIQTLKHNDPAGVYKLNHEPLSYSVESLKKRRLNGEDRMYRRMFILPSCNINFWNHSRRGGSIDGAHLTSFFEGTLYSLTVKNANQVIHTVCLGYVSSNEDADGWNWFCSLMFSNLPDAQYIISDRASSLLAIRDQVMNERNLRALNCTWMLCCLHALANEGVTSHEGKEAVTIWAKATTEEKYNESLNHLATVIGIEKASKMRQRDIVDHITFFTSNKFKLLTSYGEINTNASEQGNNLLMEVRELPLASSVITYLRNLSTSFAKNLEICNEDISKNIQIVSKIMINVFKKAKQYRHLWNVDIHRIGDFMYKATVFQKTLSIQFGPPLSIFTIAEYVMTCI